MRTLKASTKKTKNANMSRATYWQSTLHATSWYVCRPCSPVSFTHNLSRLAFLGTTVHCQKVIMETLSKSILGEQRRRGITCTCTFFFAEKKKKEWEATQLVKQRDKAARSLLYADFSHARCGSIDEIKTRSLDERFSPSLRNPVVSDKNIFKFWILVLSKFP